jgi:hypothetical protein
MWELAAVFGSRRIGRRSAFILTFIFTLMGICGLAAQASAGVPIHLPLPSITGFDHACGTAVDVNGYVYVASASDAEIAVFNPSHTKIASIPDAHEPCGLAVDTKGDLYVVDRETESVIKFTPNTFPLTGSPTFNGPTVVDGSGQAKGIAVDPADNRLYVAEGSRISVYQSDGTTGQNEMQLLNVTPGVTAGTFKLLFEGEETTALPYDANAAQVEAGLEALSSIGSGNIAVEEGDGGTRSFRLTFTHTLGSQDLPSVAANSSELTGGSIIVSSVFQGSIDGYSFDGHIGEGEVGDVTAVAAYTYGSLKYPRISLFAADSSSDEVSILYGPNIKSLEVQKTIDGTSIPNSPSCPACSDGFGVGDSGGAVATDRSDGHWFVYDDAHNVVDEFDDSGQFVTQLSSASMSDAEPTAIGVLPQNDAVQQISILGATSGSFKLGYEGETTSALPFDAPANVIEGALEGLASVGTDNVQVRMRSSDSSYIARFVKALSKRNIERVSVDIGELNDSARATVAFAPGSGPGRVYVTSGAGAGATLLAFGPLPASGRPLLHAPLSHVLANAQAVATDLRGNVYVSAGPRIHVFSPNGAEIKVEADGLGISDPGKPADLTIDSAGNIYVLDRGNGLTSEAAITYYTPTTFPPANGTTYARHAPALLTEGSLPVGDPLPQGIAIGIDDHLFAATNGHVLELDSAADGSAILNADFAGGLCGGISGKLSIAVYRRTGEVYLGEGTNTSGRICIVNSTGTKELALIDGTGDPNGLLPVNPTIAVDQSNAHVLSFDNRGGTAQEYDAAGGFVASFGSFSSALIRNYRIAIDNSCALHEPPLDETTAPTCSEYDPADGNAYVAFDDTAPETFDVTAFGPLSYGEPPAVTTDSVSGLDGGGATFEGTVDPRGAGLSQCQFEYLPNSAYEQNLEESKPAFEGALSQECTPNTGEIGSASEAIVVHGTVGSLAPADPKGRYRVHLVAENEFGRSEGEDALFGPPVVTALPTVPILYHEATLHAKVEPTGLATEYHFEYGIDGAFDHSTPIAELSGKAGPTEVAAALNGLSEGVTYNVRVVAENEAGRVESTQNFTTQVRGAPTSCPNTEYRGGIAAHLPDCRAYELITPADTGGLPLGAPDPENPGKVFNGPLVTMRGPGEGEGVSYFAVGTLPGFEGNGRRDGYLAVRAQGDGEHPQAGWINRVSGPNYSQAGGGEPSSRGVASNQSYAIWAIHPKEVFAGTLAAGTYLNSQDTSGPGGCGHTQPPSAFELLGCGTLGADPSAEGLFVSPGGMAIFTSKEQLEVAAPASGTTTIYERAAGATSTSVVSKRPDGTPFGDGEDAVYLGSSESGTSIAFRVDGNLYLYRDDKTVEVATASNAFAGITDNGKQLFYTDAANGSAPGALYMFDAESETATQIEPTSIFVNVSPDGSHVFFISKEALTGLEGNEGGEVAEATKPNLYAWDSATESTSFVARLDPQDLISFEGNLQMNLTAWTTAVSAGEHTGRANSPTRTTPDGKVLLFQSHAHLSAYENGGFSEVYRYEPSAPEGTRLICISCNPSEIAASADSTLQSVQFGSPVNAATVIPNVTNDGREVFFQSGERLLPDDVNGVIDVYEWQAKGSSGCALDQGCLTPISSGQGEKASYLFGMSASGRDVFFKTLDRLVSADVEGSASIYDARAEGGIPSPPAKAPCQGDACQPAAGNPPQVLVPSSGGSSNGNVKQSGRCPKGRHRVKGRCTKTRKKHRPGSHRRAGANRGGRR